LASRERPGKQGKYEQKPLVSMQLPLQQSRPLGHEPDEQLQPPFWQVVPLLQILPHAPQLLFAVSDASQPSLNLALQSS
jgi:hypothetical protein